MRPLFGRQASSCQSREGRWRITKGTSLAYRAGSTKPSPSLPAPKCTWNSAGTTVSTLRTARALFVFVLTFCSGMRDPGLVKYCWSPVRCSPDVEPDAEHVVVNLVVEKMHCRRAAGRRAVPWNGELAALCSLRMDVGPRAFAGRDEGRLSGNRRVHSGPIWVSDIILVSVRNKSDLTITPNSN